MLEEKSDTLDGLASQRSGAHSQKSLDRGSSARQSEAAERSVQNSDAASLGRRSSIVEEKRLQQRPLEFIPMFVFADATSLAFLTVLNLPV